jgi:hypothetical protein
MEEILKAVLAQSPLAAVLLIALYVVYKDLKKNQEDAKTERQWLIEAALDIKRRVKLIEGDTVGDISPTLPKRPT